MRGFHAGKLVLCFFRPFRQQLFERAITGTAGTLIPFQLRKPLPGFVDEVHAQFSAARNELPERLRQFVDYMVAERLLEGYGEISVILEVTERIGRRLRRANGLARAAPELLRQYGAFETDFLALFPDLIAFAQRWDG